MPKSGDVETTVVGQDKVRIELERKRGQPSIALELALPRGWRTSQSYGPNTLEPIEQPDPRMYTSLSLRVTSVEDGRGNVADRVKSARQAHVQYAERPNINTGKPELDAVRAQVEVVEDEEFPGGWSHILRVRYSYDLIAKGPYKPYVSIRCYHDSDEPDSLVELSGRLPLAAEERYLPDIRSICRNLVVLGSRE